jgi:hypothetical protein
MATTAARKTPAKTPGPKPRSVVVENTLKCQTAADGEISLSLLLPYPKLKQLMAIEGSEIPEEELVDHLLTEIMPEDVSETLSGLQDGADTIFLAIAWMQALGERLNALGKAVPSSK